MALQTTVTSECRHTTPDDQRLLHLSKTPESACNWTTKKEKKKKEEKPDQGGGAKHTILSRNRSRADIDPEAMPSVFPLFLSFSAIGNQPEFSYGGADMPC